MNIKYLTILFMSILFFCSEKIEARNELSKNEIKAHNYNNEYAICLSNSVILLFNYDINNKYLFPILSLKDENVYQIAKDTCAERRKAILQTANDGGITANLIDETDRQRESSFLILARNQRAVLTALAQEIRVLGPRKAVNLRKQIVDDNDYPLGSLRAGDSGRVTATFTIGMDGKVTQCSATGASELLNSHTCTLIIQRSSYAPALDSNQRAIEQTGVQNIRWSVPE